MAGASEDRGGRVGLVLNAGGARGAYQSGALQVLLPALERRGERPTLLVGTSAGALNVALLAAAAHLGAEEQAAAVLAGLTKATKHNVLRPLWQQLPLVALRYGAETLQVPVARLRGVLGTEPLVATLRREVDWPALHRNVEDGTLDAVTLTATVVRSGRVVGFTETRGEVPAAQDGDELVYVPTRLDVEHAMASAAIPMLFPAVKVEQPQAAAGWYVDGATRLRSPLKPALDLGVDRLLVVGTTSLAPRRSDPAGADLDEVDLGDSAVTLLNAMIEDALRRDLRRIGEVNEDVACGPAEALGRLRAARGRPPLREVPFAVVAPPDQAEISDLALDVYGRNHGSLWRALRDPDFQVMHRLLGSASPLQGEMLSFLMFDADYFAALADLGRRDAQAWLDDHPDFWQTEHVEPLRREPVAPPRSADREERR